MASGVQSDIAVRDIAELPERICMLDIRAPLIAAIAIALNAVPLDAQGQTDPPCDQTLAQQIAVLGLNPDFESSRPLSSAIIPAFGFATVDMSSAIDSTVANYMNEWGIPGGAVAITHTDCDSSGACKNHLIFAKSYGYMEVGNKQFAEPDTRFRLASVSKPITAMAILTMVHDGSLKLDDRPFPLPDLGTLIGGFPPDLYPLGLFNDQLSAVTVDEMLHHAGGWNRNLAGAPDLTGYAVLSGLETYINGLTGLSAGAPDCTELMTLVETQPLQFTPGTQTQYSNIGFCALSELIRETSGTSYFDYLKANVLSPLRMIDTTMGLTPESKRQDREAVYYDETDPKAISLFPPYKSVTAPYSSIGALEALQGAGGILSTAIDVARFAAAVASGKPANFPGGTAYAGWPQKYYSISSDLPLYEAPATGNTPYGAGWDGATCPAFSPPGASPDPLHSYNNCNFVKDGGFPGTVTSVATTADGYGFAAVFNGGDNTAPGPQSQIFWPGCNTVSTTLSNGTVMPPAAGDGANCALQAAYNHTAIRAWNVDFLPQYEHEYSGWMEVTDFRRYLAARAARGLYPSRLEGRTVNRVVPPFGILTVQEFRGRFGSDRIAPKSMHGQSCEAVLTAIRSAPDRTPLVSLQRFYDAITGAHVYQAVWSAPLP
jgi:CubicO group peptidase (beta-lactamase class C family)